MLHHPLHSHWGKRTPALFGNSALRDGSSLGTLEAGLLIASLEALRALALACLLFLLFLLFLDPVTCAGQKKNDREATV